jgi:hypothetical protein
VGQVAPQISSWRSASETEVIYVFFFPSAWAPGFGDVTYHMVTPTGTSFGDATIWIPFNFYGGFEFFFFLFLI